MSKKKYGYCPYCGEYDKLTKDHVIPQCLFMGNLPGDIPKIYACSECNNEEKSANDTYLRDLLSVDVNSSLHPVAQQLYPKFLRSVVRNQSELVHDMTKARLTEVYTSSGIFRGVAYTSPQADERTTPILSTIVRGLYYKYIGKRMPSDTVFDIRRVRDFNRLTSDVQVLLTSGAIYIPVGDGSIFECLYLYAIDRPGASIWFLSFYRRAIFLVTTDAKPTEQTEIHSDL